MTDQVDMEQLVQDAGTPYAMASEPPLSFRAEGYDYDHQVLVTLPASYPVAPDRSYPVLWAMDGPLQHIISSGTSRETMKLEEDYAASHQDLPARVFVGAGSGELNLGMSAARIVSRTTMLVENPRMRQYPGLVLKSQLYTDRITST